MGASPSLLTFSRRNSRFDFERGLDPRLQDESVGAGHPLRIEQPVERQLGRLRRRPLDPEFDKAGKLLA